MGLRVLHTADWHLGRTLEGRGRLDEQEAVLAEIAAVAAEEAVDLVVVAGDVYDAPGPPAAAEELYCRALRDLCAAGRRAVVVIAGNHDQPERVSAPGPLAGRHGAVLLGLPGEVPAAREGAVRAGPGWVEIDLPRGETAVLAALPYASEARLGDALRDTLDPAALQAAYSERVARFFALGAARFRPGAACLAVGHLYAAGGMESESERPIQVGGAYTVDATAFPAGAQYVALGHLHRPQRVAAPVPARYAGSPLAYSFSETGQAKAVCIIDVAPGRAADMREVPLRAGRPLVLWRATAGLPQVERWVEEGRDRRAFVDLEIHLDAPLAGEELQRLRRMPVDFVHIRPVVSLPAGAAIPAERRDLPVDRLFDLFYRRERGHPPSAAVRRAFLELALAGDVDGGEGRA